MNGRASYLLSLSGSNSHFWEGAGPVVATGQWTLLTMTYDGAMMRLYVNGSEVHFDGGKWLTYL